MGKHARKKQKTAPPAEVEPLGMVADHAHDTAKDEEEMRLESFLFGTTDGAAGSDDEHDIFIDDGAEYGGTSEFRNIDDDEVSVIRSLCTH